MHFISNCYNRWRGRRGWLVLALLAWLLLCGWNLSRLDIDDDIISMLPDGESRVARDFELLQQSPFARKVIIHLRTDSSASAPRLNSATEQLRDELPEPWFVDPLSGPAQVQPQRLLTDLLQSLPLLLDETDLAHLEQRLDDEGVASVLAENFSELLQPQGLFVRERIRRDPFSLYLSALDKLRRVNPLPEVRIEGEYFVSHDGLSRMILADTPVRITDGDGANQLLDAFEQARLSLPPGISAELISGHAYTLANADIIKTDMRTLLLVSGGGLLLLFVLLIGKWRAVPVLLLPFFSVATALLVLSLFVDQVSGITIGFGAVVLGITIDFALHVYFALARRGSERPEILRLVARPVLFGGLTTLAVFSVLAFSDLPGQRQLGLFAGAGIITAVLLALLVLPHFIPRPTAVVAGVRLNGKRSLLERLPFLRYGVISLWLALCGASLLMVPQLSFNGELGQLGYLPEELQQAEKSLSQAWGDVRGRAMIFVSAADLEQLLRHNEQVWQVLGDYQLQSEAVSLAPLLLSERTREQRIDNWQAFWQQHQAPTAERLVDLGKGYGFSSGAFTPFFDHLQRSPVPVDVAKLKEWGLGELVNTLLQEDENGYRLITLLPDRADDIAVLLQPDVLPAGAVLVSQGVFADQLAQAIVADFYRFISIAGLTVVLLLRLLFRRIRDVVFALLPALTGLLVLLGGMAWLGLELNLFNVIASLLIIGLGVDYGIFMVCHSHSKEDLASVRAVVVSGLSTLIGFGALTLAQHPALFSIGLTLLLGISAAMPTAILVLPALSRPSR
ncbi:MAG: MMPL family transporter [Pelovirga sp.]